MAVTLYRPGIGLQHRVDKVVSGCFMFPVPFYTLSYLVLRVFKCKALHADVTRQCLSTLLSKERDMKNLLITLVCKVLLLKYFGLVLII